MNSINSRLRRLEERELGRGRCPECPGGQNIVVVYDEAPPCEALEKRCQSCGWPVTMIRVVYDD
jgi:hypothetical protein